MISVLDHGHTPVGSTWRDDAANTSPVEIASRLNVQQNICVTLRCLHLSLASSSVGHWCMHVHVVVSERPSHPSRRTDGLQTHARRMRRENKSTISFSDDDHDVPADSVSGQRPSSLPRMAKLTLSMATSCCHTNPSPGLVVFLFISPRHVCSSLLNIGSILDIFDESVKTERLKSSHLGK